MAKGVALLKLELAKGYCCDMPDYVFLWKSVGLGTLDLGSSGRL